MTVPVSRTGVSLVWLVEQLLRITYWTGHEASRSCAWPGFIFEIASRLTTHETHLRTLLISSHLAPTPGGLRYVMEACSLIYSLSYILHLPTKPKHSRMFVVLHTPFDTHCWV
jgi:hypothetical protein